MQWSDKKQYNETLKKLAGLFQKNFEVYADYKVGGDSKLTQEILSAGPTLEFWFLGTHVPREDGVAVFFLVMYHVCHWVPLVEFENDSEDHSRRRLTISFD